MRILECTEGCYEARDVEFGMIYKWCPENLLIACNCGERSILTRSETTCAWCGTDYANAVRKELAIKRPEDEVAHPWRYAGDRAEAGMPY